ncbi:glycoside hydrolase family 2 protein [Arsenicicoccus piscis]|uniref:beta-mannosidase n=1 Tax=Arsenicicoccus piscis TaxID=673954 RepID=A0ABQ6HTB6_9MICO|nr:glycoside hydrolase family 2 protein [Arsenicicoccus piscis]MCH8627365.1 glycoside hydrolase family 2 protein [Arsenicicoccus piscis]GMA21515.1 beta-mannosidase [Arsenicicoccus piscis]GMA22166.1 beta-mannosidase [Arsenicicoccus piscis]GMA22214.1 beta-mannosidase [Arsenicicoccus piscis]
MNVTPVQGWTLRALDQPEPLADLPQGTPGDLAADCPQLWQAKPELPDSIPATVPGCVHTDLLAAGLIPDPYDGANEHDLHWIGWTRWEFATALDLVAAASDDERVELVLHGVDTVATIELGGELLAEVRNQHRTHVLDVTRFAGRGELPLVVTFDAQLHAAYLAAQEQQHRIHVNHHPFNALRKMACNFGWDWGPDLVTAGLWRPVEVRRWTGARLGATTLLPGWDGAARQGSLDIDVAVEAVDDRPLELRVTCGEAEVRLPVVDGVARGRLDVPGVEPWWPLAHGDQPLYDVGVELLDGDGSPAGSDARDGGQQYDSRTIRTGFRTVTLDTSEDGHGRRFALAVNGVELFVKGANWIPDDCFPSRITPEQYARAVADAADAGMNLLRIWGGGIYEDDAFYAACDEAGVLVWQDFLFACAAYDEERLREEVVAEVRDTVPRLSAHPSLAVWNGNNENLWGFVDWHWAETLEDRSWGYGFYLQLLPELLAELDPSRPYSPGSPWSFDEDQHPNSPHHGTMHIWDGWNAADQSVYARYQPRFVSEFGYQGPPAWSTLVGAVHDEPTTPTSPQMLVHQKALWGDDKLTYGIRGHLPLPTEFEDWHWATQLQQARAVRFAIEHFRSLQPLCMGSIVWQLNDCWPVTSWAAVDSAGIRKPLWFALREVYADRLATLQPRDGNLALVCSNDTDEEWVVEGVWHEYLLPATEGETHALEPLHVPPRGVAYRVLGNPRPGHVADVELADRHVVMPPVEPIDLPLEDTLITSVDRTADGYEVTVTSPTLTLDLMLLVDKLDPDARFDSGLVTLTPGESHTFVVRSTTDLDPAELVSARVLRSANQLVADHHGRPSSRTSSKEIA